MFIDEENYTESHSDMDYSNHINWFTGSSHNEAHRLNDSKAYVRSKCDVGSSSDDCASLKQSKDCLSGRLTSAYAMGTGSSGARRVRNRTITAVNTYLNPVKGWYNAGQCDAVLTTATPGCTQQTATNFNPNADQDDGSCIFPSTVVYGCTDVNATNYNNNATTNDGSCQYPAVYGCTDNNATNYNPNATTNDGSCNYTPFVIPVPGCMNGMATNFNPSANQDNGSCQFPPAVLYGCTDSNATNYNPAATNDDGLCDIPQTDTTVYGCADPIAQNFNINATDDDGSCTYPAGVTPTPDTSDSDLDDDILDSEITDGIEKDNTMLYVLGGLAVLIAIKIMK
jgi:hypothetical protein